MRSFASSPVVAFLISFGIQAAMLVSAWLIGESFATGMVYRSSAGARRPGPAWTGIILGILLACTALWWVLQSVEALPWNSNDGVLRPVQIVPMVFVSAVLIVATLYYYRSHHLIQPYAQALVIMLRNAVLWVMFIVAMAASVFFSFDRLIITSTRFSARISGKTPRMRGPQNKSPGS
jgi:hypothetical protein